MPDPSGPDSPRLEIHPMDRHFTPPPKTTTTALRPRRDRLGKNRELLLVTMAGSQIGRIHRLEHRPVLLIGRDDDADIQVIDAGVSRRHAAIRYEAGSGTYFLVDLESRNGTWVNGKLHQGEHQLEPGDVLELGAESALRVTASDAIEATYASEMYQAVLRDALTGLYNRRYLDDRLHGEFSYAKRHGAALSALMIDLDRFKNLNDTHGHLVGDSVLREVAKLLGNSARSEDVVVRYGGEEFAVLCRGTTQAQALVFAERLRRVVAEHEFRHEELRLHITISVGVASLHDMGFETAEQLLEAADRGLYRAKALGRNTCSVP